MFVYNSYKKEWKKKKLKKTKIKTNLSNIVFLYLKI